MSLFETSLGRRCRICGAVISDNNPDGIGFQCRDVWERAWWSGFYNFRGLELWQAMIDWWMPAFILAFRATKFRSAWKKQFYADMKLRYEQQQRMSRKQLDIVMSWLISTNGCAAKYPYQSPEERLLLDGAASLKHQMMDDFKETATDEQREHVFNCAKKFYAETSAVSTAA